VKLQQGTNGVIVTGRVWRLTFDQRLAWKLETQGERNGWKALDCSPMPATLLRVNGRWLNSFRLIKEACQVQELSTPWGRAQQVALAGEIRPDRGFRISQKLQLYLYEEYSDVLGLVVEFTFEPGAEPIFAESVRYGRVGIDGRSLGGRHCSDLWSFQGASLSWGRDEILRLRAGYSQHNSLALHDATELSPARWHYRQKQKSVDQAYRFFGGGIPLVDLWAREAGVAIGVAEPRPAEVAFPVRVDSKGRTEAAVERRIARRVETRLTMRLPRVVLFRHKGDFYHALRRYASFMRPLGLQPPAPAPAAYSPSWCGYGYNFDFQQSEMVGVIPKLRQLNLAWVTIDERWFDSYGDWQPRLDTFPGGAAELRQFVQRFHEQGFQVQLWWLPLAVELGTSRYHSHQFSTAGIARRHPEWLLLDENGNPAVGPRGLNLFCPAVAGVQEYFADIAARIIAEWDLDGHKLDAVYSVPRCFNPAHGHADPEESVGAFPEVFRRIFETSQQLKPGALIMICPCGTPPNLYLVPWMNQPVTADPISPEQLRWRTKYLKALLGDRAPVYGDHVELLEMRYSRRDRRYRELGTDFASQLGTGAVPGTRFVWPSLTRAQIRSEYLLDDKKEAHWQRWLALYDRYRLAEGEYRSLYTVGYDFPEGHVIAKGDRLYFAFFSQRVEWRGCLELRGLLRRAYQVYDYERGINLGVVKGPTARLRTHFKHHLLLELSPLRGSSRNKSE